jgi:arylsulfatase A-like enzyme/Tfp pilus assembly protein PilF
VKSPLTALFVLALASIGCGEPLKTADRILLVTIDTLRADRLGYAGSNVETPNLDALAASGTVFLQAVSSAPLTLPSHATILSGLYPTRHGTRDNGTFRVSDDVETVAETLKANGYRTAAFVGAFVLDSRFGLEQGFELYDDDLAEDNEYHQAYFPERRAEVVVSRAIDWIRAHENERFFLWVHVFDPHAPHNPPSPFAERYGENVYDAEVAYTDHALGPLFEAIRSGEGGEDVAVVVTADHGESLDEHGEWTHALFVYDSTMRVPLIVQAPGVPSGRRVERQVRTVDIAPTLLELGGVEPSRSMDGVSLRRAIEANEPEPPAYGETFVPRYGFGWSELRFLRTSRYKLIDAPRKELYDLTVDPKELQNLWSEELPPEARELERQLAAVIASEGEVASSTLPVDEETAQRLESLGYVASSPAAIADGEALPDPKDRVEIYERLQSLLGRADLTRDQLIAEYRAILAMEPANVLARRRLANTLAEERRYQEAIQQYRELLRRSEVDSKGFKNLGAALLILDEIEEALMVTEAGVQKMPWDPDMHVLKGEALERAQSLDDALLSYEKAVELRPEDGTNYWRRGAVRLKLADTARAENDFRRSLELDPSLLTARLALTRVLAQSGRTDEAERLLDEAPSEGDRPADWKAGLAEVELARGDVAKARALLGEARADEPENTRVLSLLGPLYGREGDLAKAAAVLEQAVSLGETGADVRRNLGLVYMGQGKLDLAIRELRLASEAAPRNAAIWFSLGNAYVRAGRPRDAVGALETSVALEPREDAIFNLAVAYRQSGMKRESAEAYRRFLATGVVDEARRKEAERRIAELEGTR